MSEQEDLRIALIELDKLRRREGAASRENATLLNLLDAMTRAGSSDTAAHILVDICAKALEADLVALVCLEGTEGVSFNICSVEDIVGLTWATGAELLHRPRRMVNIHKRNWGTPLPACLCPFHALLATPLQIEGEGAMALVAMSKTEANFSAIDLQLITRIAALAGQALAAQRLVRRNSLLASLIDGSVQSLPDTETFLDAPLEAVSRAFDRMTHAQGVVVALNDELLRAPKTQIDKAIYHALARTGELTGADRVYVFRRNAHGRLENTHEWVATGIEPMMEHLQDMPADLMDPWLPYFSKDQEVYIPNVAELPAHDPVKDVLAEQGIKSLLAVPLLLDEQITGFLGYDAVRETRNFLPGEVFLLRSVGNTINAMLGRRQADQRAESATSALLAERNRMQATLDAMPDLVLELNAKGHFTGYHLGHNQRLEAMARKLMGQAPDTALPRESADLAWRIIREVDANGRTDGHEFSLLLPEGRHWFQISAAARRGSKSDGGYVFVMRDITDARAQRHQIERLSEVARRTTNLVIVTDTKGRVDWVNPAFEDRSGWALADIRGKTPGSFLQSKHTDSHTKRTIAAALCARAPVSAEILNVSRLGQEYWVNLDIQPLFDERGRHKGFMAVQSDITERRAQAERLQKTTSQAIQARQRLLSAVEALKDGFALYGPDGDLLLCNQPYRNFFPKSGPLVRKGMTYHDILQLRLQHCEYKAAIGHEQAWLTQHLQEYLKPYNEVEHELADGRWVRAFEQATPDGGRVGLVIDITTLKEAERRALNERAVAMDTSHDGIAIFDSNGYFIYMNPAHRAMFGVPELENARGLHWSSLYAPEQADGLRNTAFKVLQRKGSWQGEVSGCHRNGSMIDQEVSLTLQDDGGVVCITRDITERRRDQMERARLSEELQLAQRREVIAQLAAGLAHDFNNILAVIAGSAGLIETRLAGLNADTQDATRILQATNRAAKLVARLHDLGKHDSERQYLDLRIPFAEASDLLRAGISGLHKLKVHTPTIPLAAWADPTDILQIVLNLGINARDALLSGANEITLTLATADLDQITRAPDIGVLRDGISYCMLRVADTGQGIDPVIRAKIFDAYFTSKGPKGTGLGLSIVAGIVRTNGAVLWLETQKGVGTCITIFWPVDARLVTRLADQKVEPPLSVDIECSTRLDGVKVLIIDDEEEICAVLSAILEAAGAEVASTTDPSDAIYAIKSDPAHWSVIITDHDIPKITGSMLAKAAKAITPDLPIILVSALPDPALGHHGLFAAILQKPVDARRLVREVAGAVR